MVEPQPSKLVMRVRFPSSALIVLSAGCVPDRLGSRRLAPCAAAIALPVCRRSLKCSSGRTVVAAAHGMAWSVYMFGQGRTAYVYSCGRGQPSCPHGPIND
jgi:hypothetical protein